MGSRGNGAMSWWRALLAPAADPRANDVSTESVALDLRRAADRASATRASLQARCSQLRAESASLEQRAADWVAASRDDLARNSLRRAAALLREAEELDAEAQALVGEEEALRALDFTTTGREAALDARSEALEVRRLAAEARARAYLATLDEAARPLAQWADPGLRRLDDSANYAGTRAAELDAMASDALAQEAVGAGGLDIDAWAEDRLARLREAAR